MSKPKLLSILFGIPSDCITTLLDAEYPCCTPQQAIALQTAFDLYGKPMMENPVPSPDCSCDLITALLNGQATPSQQRYVAITLLAQRISTMADDTSHLIQSLSKPAAESTASPFIFEMFDKKKETIH